MRPRITQVGNVYYDRGDGPLFTVPLVGISRYVNGGDPYVRTLMVGEQWRGIETAHIQQCSLMVIVNNHTRWDVNPTPEQQLEAAAKIVEVSHGPRLPSPSEKKIQEGQPRPPIRTMFSSPLSSSEESAPAWHAERLIYPGEHDKGVPVDLTALRLRCQHGETTCIIYLFPA